MYLVSSCLIGINCRYNGTSSTNERLRTLVKEGKAMALCPELLANLPIPRESCEITQRGGQRYVLGKSGKDYTQAFVDGAAKTLDKCRLAGVTKAILQSRSPSCGFGKIYDGTFTGQLMPGNGLTAELLSANGIEVYTEADWIE